MRFLVVDDSSTMRRIIVNTLKSLGHQEICEAGNGREGLESLKDGPFDLIITDWNMPEMSGIDFVRSLRRDDSTSQIPIVMVTTNASRDDIVEAMKAGVTSYVVKPFTHDTIREKLEAALAR